MSGQSSSPKDHRNSASTHEAPHNVTGPHHAAPSPALMRALMRALLWAGRGLCVLFLGALGWSLHSCLRPQDKPRPAHKAYAAELQRYEYKVLNMDPLTFQNNPVWKKLLKDNKRDPWTTVPAFHEKVLDSWGQKGWVLVQVVQRKPGSMLIYLRRPLN